MDHNRWERLEQLYHEALERDESRRAAFLEQACAGDAPLRQEVESLLAFDEKGTDFLETPAFELVAQSLAEEKCDSQRPGGQSLIGETVSHFHILEKLGAGGMGSVYKAEDTRLRRFVALKFLPEELERHPQAFERLRQEAQAASALNHPNICTVYDIAEFEGRPFIAMELLEGQTLRVRLEKTKFENRPGFRFSSFGSLNGLLDLAIQVADALGAAHARGIIHRDIKPQNIFVVPRGETLQAKVLDFGIARQLSAWGPRGAEFSSQSGDDKSAATLTGHVQGTPSYMSPEQARGQELDTRTDLFSFGAVLYEMATGQQAFPGDTLPLVFDAILNREPPESSSLNPEIPAELNAIIRKTLEKDREARYQTASELRADLQRLKQESSSAPLGAALGPAPTASQRSRAMVYLGLSLAGILAVAAFFLTRPSAKARLGFHRRDWVLVSRFDNRTGNPVLDGTADFAVARELSNSQFVGVVPPERVGDDLRLMKKPPGTPLDRELAREICLRDGGIRALITGRIEKIGTDYVLSAGIVDPATDAQVAGVEAQASSLNGVLPAVHQLSNQLRASLGETLPDIHESNLKLEKVTTPSLRALQLYSQADAIAIEQGPLEKPIPLLEEALAEDPNFASAHILLAWCYSNIGKWSLAGPHFQKAFELAGTVSERERLFILASYYGRFKGDHEKELQAYEALARLYPDDYWGTGNLQSLYLKTGRLSEAAEIAARRANLRPTDFGMNLDAWQSLSLVGRDAEARPFFLRARRLMTPEIEKEEPFAVSALRAGIARNDLRAGKIKAALGVTQRLAAMPAADIMDVYTLYVELGKLKLAQAWMQRLPDSPFARWLPAISADLACQRGDLAEERRILGRPLTETEVHDGVLAPKLVHCGMLRQAERQASEYDKWYARQKAPPYWPPQWGQGSLALAQGRNDDAIRLLTEFLHRKPNFDYASIGFGPADDLATAYEREGGIAEAIQALQPLDQEHLLSHQGSFHLYILYLKAGDARDAQQVRADLLRRLAYADPDYPILVQLKKQKKPDASLRSP
jgi:serine/threonine protein kinase/tetratricopeptide (TPR) repeat protein